MGSNSGNSINKNGTYGNTYSVPENNIMNILPNHWDSNGDESSKMEIMNWIAKMYKNPNGSRFIIASPKFVLKPLSKDITAIFKSFYKKWLFNKKNFGVWKKDFESSKKNKKNNNNKLNFYKKA